MRSVIILLSTSLAGIGIYACIIVFFDLPPKDPDKTIAFISSFVAAWIVSIYATRRMVKASGMSKPLTIEELDKQGLIQREKYEATRAFQVEEFEDEGSQYFIELKNGSTLFLCGQYLYDYEPMEGTRTQIRKFPCTEFVVLRDNRDGLIVDVDPGGKVIEPELEVPQFNIADFESGRAPTDGDIITDRSYDDLKREWSNVRRGDGRDD
jgi:hypothetical protein